MGKIEKYYEDYDEDSRLIKDNSHKVEFITTTHVLDEKIEAGSKILDVGAGTGRYSFYYLNKGHEITALDIVAKNVEIIKEKSKAIKSGNLEIKHGDAKDLSQFESDTFDVVLCLGPIYHLLKEEERIKCIEECLRVLKPKGILSLAYINRFAQYVVHISRDKNYVNDELFKNIVDFGTEYGDDRDCFYFSTYDEIEETMSRFRVEKLEHIGTDGIVHMMRDKINSLDENEFNEWLDYHFKTFKNPSLIGYSLHNLYVCKKI